MSTLETLKAARKLITPEQAWTKQAYARPSRFGIEIDATDPRAVCWCSTGAITKVQGINEPIWDKDMEMAFLRNIEELEMFNDRKNRTHGEVLRAFDEAIAKLEPQ
jgi:hypothetical protein